MDTNGSGDLSYLTRQLEKEQGSLDNLLLALYKKENTIKGIKERLEKLKVEGNFYASSDVHQKGEDSSLNDNQFGFNHVNNSTDKHENDSGVSESEPRPSSQARMGTTSSPTKRASFGGSGRRSSKRITVTLLKQDRLGFIVSAKDNPASDRYPIIKKIGPDGPLITNGQTLKANDKLVQVNDIEMLGKSHDEVVQILKNIPSQSSVEIIIARQESDISPNPSLPRPLPSNKADDLPQESESEVLTFEIPPNTSVVAGLGISVKGRKTCTPNSEADVGLFVNKIINGGTACIDGRLRENDRIISINGKSLVGLTNDDAMKELERTFASGKGLESITITIARCIASPDVSQPHPVSERLRGRSPSSSNSSKPVQNVDEDYYYPPNRVNAQYGNNIEPYMGNSYARTNPKYIDDNVEMPSLKSTGSMSSLENGDETHFHRDGFGRQSISEKKHASLNAKNTNTYQRNKKAKEERERERLREDSASIQRPGDSLTPVNINDQARTERFPVKPIRGDKIAKNTLFSPACCWSCQSPGSCPYHVAPQITSGPQIQAGSSLGLKKSSSLESLQTMMQDLQRGQYTPNETSPFVLPRPSTLKVLRPRHSNENFRTAINRSYDAAVNAQQVIGSGYNNNESGFPVPTMRQNGSNYSNHPSDTALSIAPSQYTAATGTSSQMSTIDNQDEVALIKRKNSGSRKSGLMRTLLRFGSGKKKKQNAKPSPKTEEDKIKMQARQAAQLEQERIQEHYRKLKEQHSQQQQAQIQSIGIPTHDAHINNFYRPETTRTIRNQVVPATPMGQQAMKLNAHAALYNSPHSDRTSNHARTPSGRVPQTSRHYPVEIRDRSDRFDRVHPMPQQFTNGFGLTTDPLITYSPSTVPVSNGYPQMRGNPNGMHTRVNSFDVRETMDRSNSGKFNHFINYRDARPEQYSQQQQQPQSNYVTRDAYTTEVDTSTGEPIDRSVPLRRLQMGTNHRQNQIYNTAIVDNRRKRPVSSYEIVKNSPNYITNEEMVSPSVNYNYIHRTAANFSSLPRHQVNTSKHNVPRSTYQPI